MADWREGLKKLVPLTTLEVLWDEPLFRHSYYRIGGAADALVFPRSKKDLIDLGRWLVSTGVPFFFVGQGSNLLFPDEGFRGVIVRLSKWNTEVQESGSVLTTGSSVAISSLMRRCAQEGWGGLEFLTGIPGLVGGSVFMNGGTHLGEASSRLVAVTLISIDGKERVLQEDDLKFGYRANFFIEQGEAVYESSWRIDREPPEVVKERIDATLARRKATQPIEFPSCGSVFKNPKGSDLQAWQVVDRLGLRGHQIGQAQIAVKHCNWIVNLGGARATDVRQLIVLVQTRARDELGIHMEAEVRILYNESNGTTIT